MARLKLIRDKIPETMGEKARLRTFEDPSLLRAFLPNKLSEETAEVNLELLQDELDRRGLIEELADVREVLDTIMRVYHISEGEVLEKQIAKAREKGEFRKGTFLKLR